MQWEAKAKAWNTLAYPAYVLEANDDPTVQFVARKIRRSGQTYFKLVQPPEGYLNEHLRTERTREQWANAEWWDLSGKSGTWAEVYKGFQVY